MIVNIRWKRWLEYVGVIFFIFHFSLFISSCSDDDSGEVIDLEKIPYLDFDAMGFDPNYDFFHRVK